MKTMSLEVFHITAEEEKTVPLKARDYKDPVVVVYELSGSDGSADGKRILEVGNTGSNEWNVCNK